MCTVVSGKQTVAIPKCVSDINDIYREHNFSRFVLVDDALGRGLAKRNFFIGRFTEPEWIIIDDELSQWDAVMAIHKSPGGIHRVRYIAGECDEMSRILEEAFNT